MRLGFRGFRGFGDGYAGDLASLGGIAAGDVVSGLRWALSACKARLALAATPPADAPKVIADAIGALDALDARIGAALTAGASGVAGWKDGAKGIADSIASVAKSLGDGNAASVAMQSLDSWGDFDEAAAATAKAAQPAPTPTTTSSGGGGGGGGTEPFVDPTGGRSPGIVAEGLPGDPSRRGLPLIPKAKPKMRWGPVFIIAGALYLLFRKKG